MAIGVFIEVLLPGGTAGTSGKPPPKNEKGAKKWVRNKLKALARLIERLGMKKPGVTGAIISWILNGAADVVGWLSQNLCALVVGIGDLLYTYMVTKK